MSINHLIIIKISHIFKTALFKIRIVLFIERMASNAKAGFTDRGRFQTH
jgi:hypothetical protein